jgi:glycine cleavage system aminomethyltransferase T
VYTPAPAQPLPLVPEIPFDPSVVTYTRFMTGYEPHEFTGWMHESQSWKKTCYLGDWSPLLKIRVTGPEALAFFSSLAINSFAKFDIGQAKHAVFCNEEGKIMGEGVLMREAEESFLFTSGPGVAWAIFQFGRRTWDARLAHVTTQQFIFQVQGPNALFVVEKATGEPLRDIGFMRFRESGIGAMRFQVLRQGMAGEVGYELHGSSADGQAVYRALLEAGEAFGIARLGGRTKMVNHVEACFPTPTVDYAPAFEGAPEFFAWFSQRRGVGPVSFFQHHQGSVNTDDKRALHRSPVELGWARSIKFDHDFIGRAALEAEVANPRRTIVTLVWHPDDVVDVFASLFRKEATPHTPMEMPRQLLGTIESDRVLVDGREVGMTTSRCYSVHFREMLSLCVIDLAHAAPGTPVVVLWGHAGDTQKRIRATVAPAPYKQDNRKVDVTTLPSYL